MELKPADIILYHGKGFSARLIQFITHSYWNHAALFLGDKAVIEASTTAKIRLFEWLTPEEMGIYRMEYLSSVERECVLIEATTYEGTVYDYLVVYWIFRRLGLRKGLKMLWNAIFKAQDVVVPHEEDEFVVCSELVQEAYANAGFPLMHTDSLMFPGTIASLRGQLLNQIYGANAD